LKSFALGLQLTDFVVTLLSFCTGFTIHQIAIFIVSQPQKFLTRGLKNFHLETIQRQKRGLEIYLFNSTKANRML